MKNIDKTENNNKLRIGIEYNRYVIEYLNKGGSPRKTYVNAINKDTAHKAFFVYNDGKIISIKELDKI